MSGDTLPAGGSTPHTDGPDHPGPDEPGSDPWGLDTRARDSDQPVVGSLRARARPMLDRHWQPRGYTVPNAAVYPHQWLWDSCFHAVVWAHLDDPERALAELANVFAHQHDDGFVPHMTYWELPELHASFWGRSMTSGITQPPMYGHAIAELVRRGVEVGDDLARRAAAGLDFVLGPRRAGRDLASIVHPWESGCDDSPRWDTWAGPDRTVDSWRQRKGELVASITMSPNGSPLANPSFEVESAAFNALVAFNVIELEDAGFGDLLEHRLGDLIAALEDRWDGDARTWADEGLVVDRRRPERTLEALLPVLVSPDDRRVGAVFEQVLDDRAFGGAFGPAQVHRDEPGYDGRAYWRGPAWPQLTYLFWVAATRHGHRSVADELAARLVTGADRSRFAEYWEPDTAVGLGAVPQSWAALALVADASLGT